MRRAGGEIERLDNELALRSREESALRLRLGQVLEVMSRGGVFELGFSSLGAYALERCDRSSRWAEAARCLARRVEELPELRHAMATGRLSWSMGELLARVARREDQAHWLDAAKSRTVREMRALVARSTAGLGQRGAAVVGDGSAAVDAFSGAPGAAGACLLEPAVTSRAAVGAAMDESHESGEAMCTLTCTVDQEEAWLFEATRALLEQLGEHGTDAQVEALLAEGQGSLLGALPEGALDPERWQGDDLTQQRWLAERARCREKTEAFCEGNIRAHLLAGRARGVSGEATESSVVTAAALGMASLELASSQELDAHVRTLSTALARHELKLSSLVLRFHRADGWRRLGYASATQYARERLGISHSSLEARRWLAQRLEKLPRVAEALGSGQLGVEAAMQVVRVATPATAAAWVAQARRRTIKHLREEVAAALVAVRWSGEVDCPPPVDAEITTFQGLEQAVVSGGDCPVPDAHEAPGKSASSTAAHRVRGEPTSEARRAWFVMLSSLTNWLDGGLQTSAGTESCGRAHVPSSAGRVTLRLRLSRANYIWWRGLEAQALPWLARGISWLRFLCLTLWQAWQHVFATPVAYGQIYARDRYRCTSPVCFRQDVTPHHLQFRSAGGSDDAQNITSACTWCHLQGVHGGRIRAHGMAPLIHWELGPPGSPCLIVHGRERVALSGR
jgi:HNH endonuclease